MVRHLYATQSKPLSFILNVNMSGGGIQSPLARSLVCSIGCQLLLRLTQSYVLEPRTVRLRLLGGVTKPF